MDTFKFDFEDYYEFIKNIYVLCHLKNYLESKAIENPEVAFMLTLTVVFCGLVIGVAFKIFIIFIYYFFLQLISNFISFFSSLVRAKCKKNLWVSFKNGVEYFFKIFEKLYFYNFYQYENNFLGAIMICIFLCYIVSSFFFMLSVSSFIEKEEKPNFYKYLQIVTIQSNIFIEIILGTFYNIRNTRKQFVFALWFFIVINLFIFLLFFYQRLFANIYGVFLSDEPRRFLSVLLNFFFLWFYSSTLIHLITYNGNKASFKLLFSEKEKFYRSDILVLTDQERFSLDEITQKYSINELYYTNKKDKIILRKNRFKRKWLLIPIFFLLAYVSFSEFVYNLCRIFGKVYDKTYENKIISIYLKVTSAVHFIVVLVLSFYTFVKIKIGTVMFY